MSLAGFAVVSRAEFVEALTSLARIAGPRPSGRVRIELDGPVMLIECDGSGFGVDTSEADWPAPIFVDAAILQMGQRPRGDDMLRLEFDTECLRLDSTRVPCRVEEPGLRKIESPANPSIAYWTAVRRHYDPEEIRAAGFAQRVEVSHDEYQRILESACRILEKIGVPSREVRRLAERNLPPV